MTNESACRTEERVAELVRSMVKPRLAAPPARDLHLFSAKLIDSFGLIELVALLEEAFGIGLDTEDLTIQNFATVESIAKMVDSCLNE